MKIIELKAENIKKLKAVCIKPDSDVMFITGANAAGKSSVLDSITMALKGGKAIPEKPIRDSEEKGGIFMDLGDYAITRTFTKSGSYLKIEGLPRGKTAQQFLDELVGNISFDPLEFMNQWPDKQAATFRELVGVDTTEIEDQIKEISEERTIIGREGKRLKGALETLPIYLSAPKEEISVKTLTDKLDAAYAHNQEIEKAERLLQDDKEILRKAVEEMALHVKSVEEMEWELEERKKGIPVLKEKLSGAVSVYEGKEKAYLAMKPIDIDPINEEISTLDDDNSKVRAMAERQTVETDYEAAKKDYEGKTEAIKKLETEKAEMFTKAKMPIPGLSIEDNGVLYNGIPLDQISDGEKLMVSLAISMALNPELRVLRIKDGSLLDSKNLKLIEDMTKENDFQIWIEKVDESGKIGIYIEEGEIK